MSNVIRKTLIIILGVTLLVALGVGCANTTTTTPTAVSTNPAAASTVAAKPTSVAASTPAGTSATSQGKRTVNDYTGQIQVPATVQRVGNNWPANNAVMLMLGAGDKLVATSTSNKTMPWFAQIYPRMKDIPAPFNSATNVNIESLLQSQPDIVIYSQGGLNADIVKQIQDAGIATAQLYLNDFDSLKTCYQQTATILGDKEQQRSAEFIQYLDGNINKVKGITSQMGADQRPRVLHIVSGADFLTVDGKNTMIDSWIQMAGGTNVATELDGNGKKATIEQIAVWNPDVIIIGNSTEDQKKTLMNDPAWANIKAVKTGKVYVNPKGVFVWDRYSSEEALQVLWAAKTLHPDKFSDIDIAKETKDFYTKFFNYNLTDDEVNRIMTGQPPAGQ